MSQTCPNCSKPVLATDTVCWHCNYPLPKRSKPKPAQRPGARGARATDSAAVEAADYDLRALVVYGLLTLAVVLGLWLVMRALSRQPILVRSAVSARDGWVSVTDNELRYTLDLPTDWQWLDVAFREQDELLDDMIERQPYVARALIPLGAGAGDLTILGVAVDTRDMEDATPAPLVVIGRSTGLGELTPQEVLDRWGDDPAVTEAAIDTRLARQPQARFTRLDRPSDYQCRHLFVADGAAGFAVAACAPQSSFGNLQHELADILDSFQLLEH